MDAPFGEDVWGISFERRCKERLQGDLRLKRFAQHLVTKGKFPTCPMFEEHRKRQHHAGVFYAASAEKIVLGSW